jgi:GNAT superfamily N-acetyltransferase
MRLEARRFSETDADDVAEWRRLQLRVYPPGEERPGANLQWARVEPKDLIIRLWDDGDLRACAWLSQRLIWMRDRQTAVAGVRGVMTHPEHRRRGYGQLVMREVHKLMATLPAAEFGLLFSSEMAVPFYEALGWRSINGPVTCEQDGGRIDYTALLPTAPVMVLMPDPALPPPDAAIDVVGQPW